MTAKTCIPLAASLAKGDGLPVATSRKWGLIALMVGLLFTMKPTVAAAQLLERYYPAGIPGYEDWFSDAVLGRPRTEYTPLGVQAGSFTLHPTLSQGFGYNSNIFNSSSPIGSAVSETSGEIGGESNWSRNALNANVNFDNFSYLSHSQASYTDWSAGLGGQIDVGQDHIRLSYVHFNLNSLPNQIGSFGISEPQAYQVDDLRAAYVAQFSRVTIVPQIEFVSYRFDNQTSNGVFIDQAVNNRVSFTGSVTTGYELAPGRSLVLLVSDTTADYVDTPVDTPKQNFNDASVLGGLDYQATGVIRYRILLGYEQRNYVSSAFATISAPAAEADVVWTPTLATTVTGRISSSIQSATTGSATGYKYSTARLVIDHEYLRDVLLQGTAEVQHANYESAAGSQNTFAFEAKVTKLINRNFSISLQYSYVKNDASPAAINSNTSGNTVLLFASFRL
jgi:hypothetical protein